MSSHNGPPRDAALPSRHMALDHVVQPLVLSFNCTCWQNRKARIYLSSPQFDAAADQNFRKSVENCGTQLVLATPTEPLSAFPFVTLPSGAKVHLFTDNGQSPFHCEFQVWKQSKDGRQSLYLDVLPPLEPERMDTSQVISANQQSIGPGGQSEGAHLSAAAGGPSPFSSSSSSPSTSTSPSSFSAPLHGASGSLGTSLGASSSTQTHQTASSSLSSHAIATPIRTGASHSISAASGSISSLGSQSLDSPTLVERSLRSRVAYSERPSRLLSRPIPKEDSIRMAKVALCNDRVYCTIDCMKGLKVQSLTLVCIFRINNQFFASDFTHFPPPSSLKRKERSRTARPKRSAPYRKKFSGNYSDEGEYDFEDELDAEDAQAAHMAKAVRGATSTSHALHGLNSDDSHSAISGFKQGAPHQPATANRRPNARHAEMTQDSGFTTPSSAMAHHHHHHHAHQYGLQLGAVLPSSIGRVLPSLNAHDLHASSDDNSFERIMSLGSLGGEIAVRNSAAGPALGFIASASSPSSVPPPRSSTHPLSALQTRSSGASLASSSSPQVQDAWNLLSEQLGAGSTTTSSRTMTDLASAAHVQSRLTVKPLIVSRNELASWCLSLARSGSWPKTAIPAILSVLGLQSFVGTIDDASAFDLLSTRLPSQALGTFLLRLAKETPWIELYGVFRSQSGSPLTGYCATIRYENSSPAKRGEPSSSSSSSSSTTTAQSSPISFWLDTETNAEDSRCSSLTDLVRYIATVTLWHPFDRDFRPPPISNLSAASASASHSSSSSSAFSSSAVYSLLPPTQPGPDASWQAWNSPQNLSAAFSSPFPMASSYPYPMLSMPHVTSAEPHGMGHDDLHAGVPPSLVSPSLHPTDLVSPMGGALGTASLMQPTSSYTGDSAFFHRHS